MASSPETIDERISLGNGFQSLLTTAEEMLHRITWDHRQPTEQEPEQIVFPDTHLDETFDVNLPFPIDVLDGGYTLKRTNGSIPIPQDVSVFIVDSHKLRQFYENRVNDPDLLLRFLESHDLGGRLLVQNGHVTVCRHIHPGWTCIVKGPNQATDNPWDIVDRLRFDFDHGRLKKQLIERHLHFGNIGEDDDIDLLRVTQHCPLRIAEPYLSMLSVQDLEELEHEFEEAKLDDTQRDEARNKADRTNLHKPNTNTVTLDLLRANAGTIPAPPVEAEISTDSNGNVHVQIQRTRTIYDELITLDPNSDEYKRRIFGFPFGTTIQQLSNISYGVNGISVNGDVPALFHGERFLTASISLKKLHSIPVTLWFNAGNGQRREALTFDITKDAAGTLRLRFIRGIEGGRLVGTGNNARIMFAHEENTLKDRNLLPDQIEKALKNQKEKEEREKKERERKKRQGPNFELYVHR